MSLFYRSLIRPALFSRPSEEIHDFTLQSLARVSRVPWVCEAMASLLTPQELTVNLFGLKFPNPVGLAAGMDKPGVALPAWAALGFGFAEVGGVTLHAQPGNPRPRMFRVVEDRALINRMGFNNSGAAAMAETLHDWRKSGHWPAHPVGVNLGKSKVTPLADAAGDYAGSLRLLWDYADFFVVNVSSPNTPNLRQLQDKAALDEILKTLQEVNLEMSSISSSHFAAEVGRVTPCAPPRSQPELEMPSSRRTSAPNSAEALPRPILVKVAPDLSDTALDEILELVKPRSIAGIVATNTTTARPQSRLAGGRAVYSEAGGLSGEPLRVRSTEVIRHLYQQTRGKLPIIGVGGIFSAEHAWEKILAGASLVQIYTGLVYEGPGLIGEIVRGLAERLSASGCRSLAEAVGQQR